MPGGTEKDGYGKHGTNDRQLVIFKIAGEEFGVDINKVKEIIRWEDVTRIPKTESYIKGVINLRGSIVVVNDLAMKLGLPSKEVDEDTRILVVEVDGNTVGMVVDSATEVLHLEGEKVQDAPDMITSGIDYNYIDGVGLLDEKRLLTLLDLSKVMVSKDYEKILQAQKEAQKHIQKSNSKEPVEEATPKESKSTPEEVHDDSEVNEKKSKTTSKKKKK
jgi:purine-binding chemotaxis protein CheW